MSFGRSLVIRGSPGGMDAPEGKSGRIYVATKNRALSIFFVVTRNLFTGHFTAEFAASSLIYGTPRSLRRALADALVVQAQVFIWPSADHQTRTG
jgi:hypothetical protein